MLCARECPDWCIYIDSHKETIPATTEGGRERQRNVLDRFAIDFSLCMYCGICIEVCPFDALHWSPEFEYAELDIRDLLHEKDRLGQWMPTVPPPPALDPDAAEPAEIAAAKPARRPTPRAATTAARPPPRRRPRGRDRPGARPAGTGRMTALDVAFAAVGLVAAASALLAVTTRHVVHAALWLVVTLGALAGCYLVLGAELVALVQLLVYVGAVVVLVLFALMLTRAPIGPQPRRTRTSVPQRVAGAVVGAGTTALLAGVLVPALGGQAVQVHDGRTPGHRRRQLFGVWVWPFELLSLLLLVALVAAFAVSRMPAGPTEPRRDGRMIHLGLPLRARRPSCRRRRLRRDRPPQRGARADRRRADPQRRQPAVRHGRRRCRPTRCAPATSSPCSSSPSPPPRSASRSPSCSRCSAAAARIDLTEPGA